VKAAINKISGHSSQGYFRWPDLSGFNIEVKNLYRRTIVPPLEIKNDIREVLKALKAKGAELSLLLVDKAMMRRLNRKYRGRDSSTDVLSFDLRLKGAKGRHCLSGDIVVSVDDARHSATSLHISLQEELYRYIIHGILHLLNYDDTTWLKKQRMWKRQEDILKKIMRSPEHQAPRHQSRHW
jgi:rRNA maturation RNase YbeY